MLCKAHFVTHKKISKKKKAIFCVVLTVVYSNENK